MSTSIEWDDENIGVEQRHQHAVLPTAPPPDGPPPSSIEWNSLSGHSPQLVRESLNATIEWDANSPELLNKEAAHDDATLFSGWIKTVPIQVFYWHFCNLIESENPEAAERLFENRTSSPTKKSNIT